MCGRFYVDPEDRYFRELAEAINRSPLLGRFSGKVPEASGSYGGEVLPASVVPVLAPNRKGERAVFPMQWGYTLPPRPDSKKPALVINARSEPAGSKPLFRESWGTRRCVIPATAYFEWEHTTNPDGKVAVGQKYRIHPLAGSHTFLAGPYRLEQSLPVFVILTREPAEDLRRIHDRMPLMLPEESLASWLSPEGDPEKLLSTALTSTAFAAV